MATDTPQTNFQSNQNFDPDVRQMYKHFVTGGATVGDNEQGQNVGIDDLRGQISVSVTSQNTKNLLAALNISPTSETPAPTTNTSTPVQSVQESRCHTFYRIIGFPVVSQDQATFYNPGFDSIKGVNITRKITLATKIMIAGNVGSAFEAISQARETYAAGTSQIFSVPESVEAGVLALTSGTYGSNGNVNIRKFAQPFLQSTYAFDFNVNNQSYAAPGDILSTTSLVGDKEITLADYQDATGVKPNPGAGGYKILLQHRHIIKPFMVDPRIDFSVWTAESKTAPGIAKRIAVPFVPNASYLKTSDTGTAERPLLEKVITERFSSFNTATDAGMATADLISYVQNFKTIQSINIGSTPISNIFTNSAFKVSQQQSFAQYLSTIQALMFKLVDSMRIIHARQGSYYWLPIPSISGPEGGSTVRSVPLNSNVSTDLMTINDFDIINNQAQVILSSLTPTIATSTSTPDAGGYAFSNYKLTFDTSTSDSVGDLSTRTQNNLNTQRNRLLSQASDALQIVEMIMGEFSGLGLADIVAVMGALYVMPATDLLGFLDDDAIVRAETVLGQQSGSLQSQRPNIADAMASLANTVNAFYQIMDQVFQDYLNNNALNL
jgi:hypothetical protein